MSLVRKMNQETELTAKEAHMLQQIWDEIRYVRKRLDDHVNDEDQSVRSLREDMTKVREDIRGHKTKLGLMLGAVGVAITGLVSWMANHISKLQ